MPDLDESRERSDTLFKKRRKLLHKRKRDDENNEVATDSTILESHGPSVESSADVPVEDEGAQTAKPEHDEQTTPEFLSSVVRKPQYKPRRFLFDGFKGTTDSSSSITTGSDVFDPRSSSTSHRSPELPAFERPLNDKFVDVKRLREEEEYAMSSNNRGRNPPSLHNLSLNLTENPAPSTQDVQESHDSADPNNFQALMKRAAAGQIEEVDLGPLSKQKAEQATQDLLLNSTKDKQTNNHTPTQISQSTTTTTSSSKLKPNTKPNKPRKKRRNSNDLRRDLLVEKLMSTSSPSSTTTFPHSSTSTSLKNPYITPTTTDTPATKEEEEENNLGKTDNEVFENFTEEYKKQQEESRRLRRIANERRGDKEKSKGPKLGGSRSARAAMYALNTRESEKNKIKKK